MVWKSTGFGLTASLSNSPVGAKRASSRPARPFIEVCDRSRIREYCQVDAMQVTFITMPISAVLPLGPSKRTLSSTAFWRTIIRIIGFERGPGQHAAGTGAFRVVEDMVKLPIQILQLGRIHISTAYRNKNLSRDVSRSREIRMAGKPIIPSQTAEHHLIGLVQLDGLNAI
ncbi:hypothetical protein MPH_01760 [Macrophomina phaseolina MS6]|uniref:Uncharacterized protein n=1 Tax=Macrophomina phaseolina (strain MS6) TaxID=1126212 RepID=K2REF0_MACPH|nr:hypothetical protein MPH_01760 [Macrophomina phaseolina MS6]